VWKPTQRPALTRADLIEASETRFRKLNLEALDDHGTLEFRHHNGSVDPTVVCNWIRFAVNFIERSSRMVTEKRSRDLGPLTGLTSPVQTFYKERAKKRSRNFEVWATA
jgi:hypothetical protein